MSVIHRPRDVGGGTQQFFDITWAAVTTEKHLSRTNKGVLVVLWVYLSSYFYYNEKTIGSCFSAIIIAMQFKPIT